MKNDRSHRIYDRFMHWAEGTPTDPMHEPETDPELQEFNEYLEYLDAHEHIDFQTYRQMRHHEREDKGLPEEHAHHHHEVHEYSNDGSSPRRRPGALRRAVSLYRVTAVAVVVFLTAVMLGITLQLPAFGDAAAPVINSVSERYLEQGIEETGAVNAVAGMILDYRAFDTFGESTVLFAATMSVILLMREPGRRGKAKAYGDRILKELGQLILPAVMMYGIYVVLNGHLSPGGGFSGGTVLGCGLILASLTFGQPKMEQLLPQKHITRLTVGCLLAYGMMKSYSFLTGANHIGWEVPKGTPGAILSAGFILPLNICVGIIVACTMYTFYTLFSEKEG